jgi:hypothetical protein
MTGPLVLPSVPPIDDTFAANKWYVDSSIAAAALYQGVWRVAANTPDLDPAVAQPLHTYSWIAITVDPAVPETAPAGLPGIGGMGINEGDNVVWNDNLQLYDLIRAVGAVGNYVSRAGDTMTGTLVAPSFEVKTAAQAASGVRLFPAAPPNAGRIDFQTADGSARKGYVGYGSDTDLVLHAETGVTWRVSGGLGFGSTAATSATDLSNHIMLFGATFGFSITSGTLNYVVPAASFHKFLVGTANKLQVDATGCLIGTAAVGDGYSIGDMWHGMYFNGSNTLVFTEYHNRFEWRAQTSGTKPGGTLAMTLYGGTLDVKGQLNCRRENSMLWNTKSLIVSHTTTAGAQATTGGEAGIALYNYNGTDGGLRKHVLTLEKVADRFVARNGDDAAGACIKFVASGFDTVSDLRYKHDVRAMEDSEVASAFAALSPIRFRWNWVEGSSEDQDQRLQWGLSANALEQAAPDAVTTGSFGEKSYGIEQVLAIAIAKIKLLEAEIEQLKGR